MAQDIQTPIQPFFEQYYPFWDRLTPQEQRNLCSCSSMQSFRKSDFIYSRDGDCLGILLVLKGQLRIYIQSDDSREITLFRVGPGQVCTLSASCIMREITFDISIAAQEDTLLLTTGIQCFRRLMEQNIYVQNFVYKHTAESFSDAMWALSELLFSSFDSRLAAYLLDEARRTRSRTLYTTHEEIARNLGSAREVVSRMLKYFEKESMVALSRGSVRITNAALLEQRRRSDR